jgi:demethylmenaquinone methyltransferase/2-methoxy-6-polyprenyl-1,4-benzoquinol methylase
MGLFRKSDREPLGVTMAGVKLGHRMLAVGTRDPKLIAALAVKAGVTGRACVVDENDEQLARGASEIEKEGGLVEPVQGPLGTWPFEAESFDVAVITNVLPGLDAGTRGRCVSEVYRVLRPGGRAVIIEAAPRGGIGGLLQRKPANADYKGPTATLKDCGFTAVRVLAEEKGVTYAEGIKRG